jgi:hypothetical protein
LKKKQGEIIICEEKELNKPLCFKNRTPITGGKERQLKTIN